MKASDRLFLAAAVELAERGRFTCAPNPTVGCLIVRDQQILGRGFHAYTGEGHAEVNAMTDAGGSIAGSTVYVSLEPCAFVGRTPACAQTLIDADVARVVVAAEDPHPQVAGNGIKMLRNAGVEVTLLTQQAALNAVQGYTSRITQQRPFVRVKTASSIDGGIATGAGESQWITSAQSRADVQYWRARSDAVITGIGTVVADNPQLNVRDTTLQPFRQPLRVVLDSLLRISPESALLQDKQPTLLVHNPESNVPVALTQLDGVSFFSPPHGPANLQAVLEHLAQLGCNEVLIEGGAKVCGSFVESGLWDEWLCYIAPKWLGKDNKSLADFTPASLAAAPAGEIVETHAVGPDMRVRILPATQI